MRIGDVVWIVFRDLHGEPSVRSLPIVELDDEVAWFEEHGAGFCVPVALVYQSPRAAWQSVVDECEAELARFVALRDAAHGAKGTE